MQQSGRFGILYELFPSQPIELEIQETTQAKSTDSHRSNDRKDSSNDEDSP
jgi:hypothetical protein